MRPVPDRPCLDIAWRIPVTVVTIPLDLVGLPIGFVLFALGYHH